MQPATDANDPSLERLLRPERPKLAEAQQAVEGLYDSREAWEAMSARGLIPSDWLHNDLRSYIVDSGDGVRRAFFPPTVRLCIALAADARNIAAAEQIARSFVKDVRFRDRVVWRGLRTEAVGAHRDSLLRSIRDGSLVMPPEMLNTGYSIDPFNTEAIVLLMPEP